MDARYYRILLVRSGSRSFVVQVDEDMLVSEGDRVEFMAQDGMRDGVVIVSQYIDADDRMYTILREMCHVSEGVEAVWRKWWSKEDAKNEDQSCGEAAGEGTGGHLAG